MFLKALMFAAIIGIAVASLPVVHEPLHHHAPQPYKFGYDVKDKHGNQYREEQGNGAGGVKGSYGFADDRGVKRQVDYVADHAGFRAQVKTNEPGTANQNPAAVQMISAAPYTGGVAFSGVRGAGLGYGVGNVGLGYGIANIGLGSDIGNARQVYGVGNAAVGYGVGNAGYGVGNVGFGYGVGNAGLENGVGNGAGYSIGNTLQGYSIGNAGIGYNVGNIGLGYGIGNAGLGNGFGNVGLTVSEMLASGTATPETVF